MSKKRLLPKSIKFEEFKKLVNAVPRNKKYVKLAFILAYGSGLRVSEVLRCRPEHFENNSIFIPESKYGVERRVPIPKMLKPEHTKLLPIPSTSIKSGSRKLEFWVKTYCKKAGLNPAYTFHSLRHGFATDLLEKGAPINHVQLLLGHSNISVTSIYTRANPVDALKSYEDLF
jgi:integrase/recombinase XerD